jgi:hypothetical protein
MNQIVIRAVVVAWNDDCDVGDGSRASYVKDHDEAS